MRRRLCVLWCVILVGVGGAAARADEHEALIALLIKKGLITESELNEVKTELASQPTKPMSAPAVTNARSLRISGRWAAGYQHSGKEGTNPSGAFRVPDAKLRFDVQPDAVNTLVTRLNVSNATFNDVDYLYMESKDFLPWLKDSPVGLTTRLGRVKMDFGEETWSNNAVESALPSTSIANVAGHDEGLQLMTSLKSDWSPRLSLGVFNGNSGGGTDNTGAKAYSAKLSVIPVEPLFLSISFFDSRETKGGGTELGIGGLTTAPAGAVNWARRVWEVDARYDIGRGSAPLNPPAFTDSTAYLRTAYGLFTDSAKGGTDRRGDYAYLEGLWNFHPRWHAASRWSILDFDHDVAATIGGITGVKREQRYALGGGFRWSESTLLKGEWLVDHESGRPIADDASNNQFSLIAASQF